MQITRLLSAVLAVVAFCSPAWASGDVGVCEPSWRLSHSDLVRLETTVMLAPSNDTLVNMTLLRLQATGQQVLLTPRVDDRTGEEQGIEGPFYLADSISFRPDFYGHKPEPIAEPEADPAEPYGFSGNPRCQSDREGRDEFIAAVREAGLEPQEEQALIAGRLALSQFCQHPDQTTPIAQGLEPQAKSPRALPFARYLQAAWAFYGYDDPRALGLFAAIGSLAEKPTVPWVHEAATYMEGRAGVEMVKLTASGRYGLLWPQDADPTLVEQAYQAFDRYLTAFPKGRYRWIAEDAQDYLGWLGKSRQDFVATFSDRWGPRLSNPIVVERDGGPSFRFWYVDHMARRVITLEDLPLVKDPFFLAALDLYHMRREEEPRPGCWDSPPRVTITAQDLDAQAPRFADQPALYQMLRATYAFYLAKDPQTVLALIPDDSAQPAQGTVPFTLRMLRGMALNALNDPSARAYWRKLLAEADQPGQRPLVELAIALQAQNALPAGGAQAKQDFYALFAPDSPLTVSAVRERLLLYVADAPLLRQQAKDPSRPQPERERALFTLLYKSLTQGQTKQFAADLALVPNDANRANPAALLSERPALDIFAKRMWSRDFSCPSLKATAARLARNPKDAIGQICVAEMVRLGRLDDFTLDHPPANPEVLGGGPSLFPGQPYNRMSVYRRIMDDPKAPSSARAYALFRAVRCYAPSGYNHCWGQDAPLEERRAWFFRLKKDYPNSRWAQELKFYW